MKKKNEVTVETENNVTPIEEKVKKPRKKKQKVETPIEEVSETKEVEVVLTSVNNQEITNLENPQEIVNNETLNVENPNENVIQETSVENTNVETNIETTINEEIKVEEITDIHSEIVEEKKINCELIRVDTVEEFIKLIEDGHDIESVFLNNKKLYKKLNKKIKKLIKKDEFYLLRIRLYLNNEIPCYFMDKPYKLLKKFKNKENPYYSFYMGEVYRYGLGVKRNYKKAFEFYQKASEFGVNAALVALGECYLYGLGVDKYEALAYKNFCDASELGNKKALLNKAILLQNGSGVEKNVEEAFKIIESIKDHIDDAYYEYGKCYLYGLGIEKDYKKAIEIAKTGINKKNYACNILLGISHLYAMGNKRSYRKARKYFIKAIDKGYYDGCYFIGLMKFNGFGLWKSSKDAFEVFSLGYEHHSLLCQNVLEERYKKDKKNKFKNIVKKDKKTPIYIFKATE